MKARIHQEQKGWVWVLVDDADGDKLLKMSRPCVHHSQETY